MRTKVLLVFATMCAVAELPAQGKVPVARPGPRIISEVSAAVDIPSYQGRPCPAKLNFTGTIVAEKTPSVPITYQWVRSDKSKGPVRRLTMHGRGAVVTDTWKVGTSGEMMRAWEELHVLTPDAIKSNQATSVVLCK